MRRKQGGADEGPVSERSTMTVYSDQELEAMLSDLESDLAERKESFNGDAPTNVREAVCAFANDLPDHRRAGVVFVGARDDGSPADLSITDELLLQLQTSRPMETSCRRPRSPWPSARCSESKWPSSRSSRPTHRRCATEVASTYASAHGGPLPQRRMSGFSTRSVGTGTDRSTFSRVPSAALMDLNSATLRGDVPACGFRL